MAEILPATPQASTPWTIRPYQPGDEQQIVALYSDVFKIEMATDYWLWKFKSLPSPIDNVWLAVVEDQPVFQYASIPLPYHLPGGLETVMVWVDAMTARPHRRQGLLSQVATQTHERFRQAGISFVFGMPNDKWGTRISYLGWRPLFPLAWLAYPLRPFKLLASKVAVPGGQISEWIDRLYFQSRQRSVQHGHRISVTQVDEASDEFDQLWHSCRQDFSCSIIRDQRWVNWRFLKNPDKKYVVLLALREGVPAAYLAYLVSQSNGRKIATIADFFSARNDIEARQSVLHHLFEQLWNQGVDNVVTLAVPGNWLFKSYRAIGFIQRPNPFSVMVIPLTDDSSVAALANPDGWMLTGADFDVV